MQLHGFPIWETLLSVITLIQRCESTIHAIIFFFYLVLSFFFFVFVRDQYTKQKKILSGNHHIIRLDSYPISSVAHWKASFSVCSTEKVPKDMAVVYYMQSGAIQCKQAPYIAIWSKLGKSRHVRVTTPTHVARGCKTYLYNFFLRDKPHTKCPPRKILKIMTFDTASGGFWDHIYRQKNFGLQLHIYLWYWMVIINKVRRNPLVSFPYCTAWHHSMGSWHYLQLPLIRRKLVGVMTTKFQSLFQWLWDQGHR